LIGSTIGKQLNARWCNWLQLKANMERLVVIEKEQDVLDKLASISVQLSSNDVRQTTTDLCC
jgi:hypothetical protein